MYTSEIRYVQATKISPAKAIQFIEQLNYVIERDLPSTIAVLQEYLLKYSHPQSVRGMYVCDRDGSSRGDRHKITERIVSFSRLFIEFDTVDYDDRSTPVLFGERVLLPEEEAALADIQEAERIRRLKYKQDEFEKLKRELGK